MAAFVGPSSSCSEVRPTSTHALARFAEHGVTDLALQLISYKLGFVTVAVKTSLCLERILVRRCEAKPGRADVSLKGGNFALHCGHRHLLLLLLRLVGVHERAEVGVLCNNPIVVVSTARIVRAHALHKLVDLDQPHAFGYSTLRNYEKVFFLVHHRVQHENLMNLIHFFSTPITRFSCSGKWDHRRSFAQLLNISDNIIILTAVMPEQKKERERERER